MENINEKVNANENSNVNENYFTYYVFIFINSIIGFIVTWKISEIVMDMLAYRKIINLMNVKQVVSMLAATTVTIAFMFIAMSLKKTFKRILLSEIFLYIYIGGLTTLINIVIFNISLNLISTVVISSHITWKVAEVIAFIVAVTFAFIADKIVVFKSFNLMPTVVFNEIGRFIGARIVTEGINIAIMLIFIDLLNKDKYVTKIGASIIVIIVNYLFSKYIVFKKKAVIIEKNVKVEKDSENGNLENVENKNESN